MANAIEETMNESDFALIGSEDNGSLGNNSEWDHKSSHVVVAVLLWYQGYHGFVSLVICPFSVATNVLNIIVLTRSKMRSPINYLLSGLAAIDIAKMSTYFLFALNMLVLNKPEESAGFSKFEIIAFLLVAQNLVITLHLTSMMLAIMLAFYRYVIMRSALGSQYVLTMRDARITLVAVTLVAVVLCSPNYLRYKPYQSDASIDSWWYKSTEFAAQNPELCFYIYGLVGKVGGSVVLVVLFALLLATLREAAKSSRKVRGKPDVAAQRRLTMMLVGIVLVFVVAELPQGVLLILSTQPEFFDQVYTEMGDFLDLLTMLSSSVNFILYCSMSAQFRNMFVELFVAPCRALLLRDDQGKSTSSALRTDDSQALSKKRQDNNSVSSSVHRHGDSKCNNTHNNCKSSTTSASSYQPVDSFSKSTCDPPL